MLQKEKKISQKKLSENILDKELPKRVFQTPFGKVSSVKEVIGLALDQIGSYAELTNVEQKVALINEVRLL